MSRKHNSRDTFVVREECKKPFEIPSTTRRRELRNRAAATKTPVLDDSKGGAKKRISLPLTKSERKDVPSIRQGTFVVENPQNKELPDAWDTLQRPPLIRSRTYTVLKEFEGESGPQESPAETDPAESICNKTFIIRRANNLDDIVEIEDDSEDDLALIEQNTNDSEHEKPETGKGGQMLLQDIPRRNDVDDSDLIKFKNGHKVQIGLLLEAILSPTTRNTPGAAFDFPETNVRLNAKQSVNVQCQTTVDHSRDAILPLKQELLRKTNQVHNKRATAFENEERISKLREELDSLHKYVDDHALHEYHLQEAPSVKLQFEGIKIRYFKRCKIITLLEKELLDIQSRESCMMCKGTLHRLNPELKEYFDEEPVPRCNRVHFKK